MIDIHSHIIPGIDDGARDMEQSFNMAVMASREGIDTIVATPHFMEDSAVLPFMDKVMTGVEALNRLYEKRGIDVEVIKGAEVFISPSISTLENVEKLCINDGRYMLIELPMMDMPLYVEDCIYNLQLQGITPVIAHPERYHRVLENPNLLYPLIDMGAIAQINSGSITGRFGKRVQKCARILVETGMVHIVGTDAHSDRTRSPRIIDAYETLVRWTGAEMAVEMTRNRNAMILDNKPMEFEKPVRYKRGISFLRGFGRF